MLGNTFKTPPTIQLTHLGNLRLGGILHVECTELVVKQRLDLRHGGAGSAELELLHVADWVVVVDYALT